MQQLLLYWDLSEEHYPLVRNLFEKDVRLAPVALAGFGRESDLPVLRELIDKDDFLAMHIISRFPDDSFLPIVKDMLDEEIRKSGFINNLDGVFRALLAYPETVVMEVLSPYIDGDNSDIYVFDDLLAIIEEYRNDELPRVLINAAARSDMNTFPSTAGMLVKHNPEGSANVLLYLIKEVQQASYLARAIATLEIIDASALSVDVLEQNPFLNEPWEYWKGDNCFRMIDYHVSGVDLRKRLRLQCRPNILIGQRVDSANRCPHYPDRRRLLACRGL